MSLILMMTTLFSSINVNQMALFLGAVLLVTYVIGGVFMFIRRSRNEPLSARMKEDRATWRMPPINLLQRPKWSRGRTMGMYSLRAYLVIAVVMLLVKAIQLGLHK
jgi:hypothetical protein